MTDGEGNDGGGDQAPLTVRGLHCTLFLPDLKLLRYTKAVQHQDTISQILFSTQKGNLSRDMTPNNIKFVGEHGRHAAFWSTAHPLRFDQNANVNTLVVKSTITTKKKRNTKEILLAAAFLSQGKATE